MPTTVPDRTLQQQTVNLDDSTGPDSIENNGFNIK